MLVALEKSTIGSLREMQHKDQYGNVISSFTILLITRCLAIGGRWTDYLFSMNS